MLVFIILHNNEAFIGAFHNINDTDKLLTPINGISINNNIVSSQNNIYSTDNTNSSGSGY